MVALDFVYSFADFHHDSIGKVTLFGFFPSFVLVLMAEAYLNCIKKYCCTGNNLKNNAKIYMRYFINYEYTCMLPSIPPTFEKFDDLSL